MSIARYTAAAFVVLMACGASAQTPQVNPQDAPPPRNGPSLGGTTWQLLRFQRADDHVHGISNPSEYTITFLPDGQLNLRIGCDKGFGTWHSPKANELHFHPRMQARVICGDASTHDRILRDWNFIGSYAINDGHLFLVLMADAAVYEFAPLGTVVRSTSR